MIQWTSVVLLLALRTRAECHKSSQIHIYISKLQEWIVIGLDNTQQIGLEAIMKRTDTGKLNQY